RASAEHCLHRLVRSGCTVEAREVRHFDEARTLSRDANRAGYDAVVAVGGDGTINKVLNGFFDAEGRRNSRALFGVVHTGTSPDFCRSYGVPRDVDGAVDALVRARVRSVPVGRVRFGEVNGEVPRSSCFVCCANIGLGAALAVRANAGIRRRLGDTMGTFVSLLAVLRSYTPVDYTLRLDGAEVSWDRVYNISIGLTPFIASGIRIDNSAMSAAGRFYVMVLRDVRLRTLPGLLRKLYSGKSFPDSDTLFVRDCAALELPRQRMPSDVEHDGDAVGQLPCTISRTTDDIDLIH
ncbi:MAG: diacylglycerol kinase family protein, partial [Bacteroidota bacterium]|nr:diacylglycerol kinase family protein [Bacteroidota bacterium]